MKTLIINISFDKTGVSWISVIKYKIYVSLIYNTRNFSISQAYVSEMI